jgi:molybdopterin synthase catalytic subunit
MIELTHDPIQTQPILDQVRSRQAGAICLFLGTVREFTGGKQTLALEYEAYPEMARRELEKLEQQARQRWPITKLVIVHRLGRLELGEISVAVAVSTPHRNHAFEACQFLIDTLKQTVPIWKKEEWSDGSHEWVHPFPSAGSK